MINEIVGYLLHRHGSLVGESGFGYNYVLSGNGVYIRAENSLLSAYIPIAICQIRGLTSTDPCVELKKGKIPGVLFDLAMNAALARKEKEVYFAITWQDKYHLFMTSQEGKPAHVQYQAMDNTILDLHTHPTMAGHFSRGDDADDQGLRLSAVIGRLDRRPEVSLRVGVYGYFWSLSWNQVFEGTLTGVQDKMTDFEAEDIDIELQNGCEIQEGSIGRSWWNRFLGR